MKQLIISFCLLIVFSLFFGKNTVGQDPTTNNTSKYIEQDGEKLYNTYCVRCHGDNGNRGFPLSKKLTRSKKSDEKIIRRIKKGKFYMPSFKDKLTDSEINILANYIKKFRKK